MKNTNNKISKNIYNQPTEELVLAPPTKSNTLKYLFILCFVILLASMVYSFLILIKINSQLSTIKPEDSVSQITPTEIIEETIPTVTISPQE